MRSWLLAPLGLVVAVTLCGCSSATRSGHSANRPVKNPVKRSAKNPVERAFKPASLAELRWLGKLDSQYGHDQDFAASCQISTRSGLGKPPTPRLRHYVTMAAVACKDFERGTNAAGTPDAQKSLNRSVAVMDRANQAVDKLRPSLQPLPRIAGSSGRSRIAIQYTRVAVAIDGNPRALVRCWSISDWARVVRRAAAYWGSKGRLELLGFVMQPHFISLSPEACRSLDELVYEHARPKDSAGLDEIAIGLNALAHESEHVRHPYMSEAVVECYAMQEISSAARLLVGRSKYGELVARHYAGDLYAKQPLNYKSGACRNNGPLDLHPARARWP